MKRIVFIPVLFLLLFSACGKSDKTNSTAALSAAVFEQPIIDEFSEVIEQTKEEIDAALRNFYLATAGIECESEGFCYSHTLSPSSELPLQIIYYFDGTDTDSKLVGAKIYPADIA